MRPFHSAVRANTVDPTDALRGRSYATLLPTLHKVCRVSFSGLGGGAGRGVGLTNKDGAVTWHYLRRAKR